MSALVATSPSHATGYKLKELYAFCAQTNCSDGQAPHDDLTFDSQGNLFGATADGGDNSDGVVYELVNRKHKWIFKRLYSFCHLSLCTDGGSPSGHLVLDVNENVYGMTREGGGAYGTVFRLTRAKGNWSLETLYTFCSHGSACLDGAHPSAGLTYKGAASGLPYDGVSPLYGVTEIGGVKDKGVAFSITPGTPRSKYKTIYYFCALTNCTDGALPEAPLVADASGNLYGTANVVFELSPKGKSFWRQTVLYSFCQLTSCADGNGPEGALVMDANENLIGTACCGGPNGKGVVFRLTPDGKHSQYSVLHTFCAETDCTDGGQPSEGVAIGPNGDVFGVSEYGGKYDQTFGEYAGTAFRLSGSDYSVIYDFCGEPDCIDGEFPRGNVTIDSKGHVFGIAQVGGEFKGGDVYELTQ